MEIPNRFMDGCGQSHRQRGWCNYQHLIRKNGNLFYDWWHFGKKINYSNGHFPTPGVPIIPSVLQLVFTVDNPSYTLNPLRPSQKIVFVQVTFVPNSKASRINMLDSTLGFFVCLNILFKYLYIMYEKEWENKFPNWDLEKELNA